MVTRILQVVSTLSYGGIETFIMNVYRNIDRNKIQFDFLVQNESEGIFDKEVRKLGGKIFRISYVTKVGHFSYIKNLNNFFENNKYSVIHSHVNTMSGFVLKEAKKHNIPIRITHSHNTKYSKNFFEAIYKNYSKLFIKHVATDFFACSKKAGISLFGDRGVSSKFKIIYNGVKLDKYRYSSLKKEKIMNNFIFDRKKKVIGHIGRFEKTKNHKFILEIFKKIKSKNNNFVLLLIGEGKLKDNIIKLATELKIIDDIIFLGIRDDVNEILQIIDYILFPSVYEGLPVTLVEAQAAGVMCFISNSITKEIDLGINLIKYNSLKDDAEVWAEEILKCNYTKTDTINILKKSKYNILSTAQYLEKYYLNSLKHIEGV